jgi:hypothetical protein
MARLELDIDTDVAAERVLSALTDFSDRRPDLWPGLKLEEYEVYDVGDTWAEVREGSGGAIWARERYDWSRPGNVTWTVQESGFSQAGDFVSVQVEPRSGGGSRVHVLWSRRGKNLLGRVTVALIVLLRGGPVKGSIMAGLKRIQAESATS